DIKPKKNNPVVCLLKNRYGVPYERIYGKKSTADDFAKDCYPSGKRREKFKERFKDYVVVTYGVSSKHGLPEPQLMWQSRGMQIDCWQIQINRNGCGSWIEATWHEEHDNYEVVTIWGSLEKIGKRHIRKQATIDMRKGMELFVRICEQMS